VQPGVPRLSHARPRPGPRRLPRRCHRLRRRRPAARLRQSERLTGILRQFAAGFTDHRHPDLLEPWVEHLLAPRVDALALGSEDLKHHDDLRRDPRLATVVGQDDPTGKSRQRPRDRGRTRAGNSTRNRLELTPGGAEADRRSQKIACRTRAVQGLFVTLYLQAQARPPERIVLDRDAPDDPIHGHQPGRFFHGYSQGSCELRLYIFCGDPLRCVGLRPADTEASAGSVKQLRRIVASIRQAWPQVKIVIRADSGFGRDAILSWCQGHDGDDLDRPGQEHPVGRGDRGRAAASPGAV
jgi:hypothetical protein